MECLDVMLSPEAVADLWAIQGKEKYEKCSEYFHFTSFKTDLRHLSILDALIYAIRWAQEEDFSSQSTALFLNMFTNCLTNVTECSDVGILTGNLLNLLPEESEPEPEEPNQQEAPLESIVDITIPKSLSKIKSFIVEDVVKPPVLSAKELALSIDYIRNTVVQHFELYRYCLTHPQEERVIQVELPVYKPPISAMDPLPLNESLPEEVYLEQLALANQPSLSETEVQKEKKKSSKKNLSRSSSPMLKKSKSRRLKRKKGKERSGKKSKSPAPKKSQSRKMLESPSPEKSRPSKKKETSRRKSKSPPPKKSKSVKTLESPSPKKSKSVKTLESPSPKKSDSVKTLESPSPKKSKSVKTLESPSPKKSDSVKTLESPSPKKSKSVKTSESPSVKKSKSVKILEPPSEKKSETSGISKSPSPKKTKHKKKSPKRKKK